MVEIAPEAAFAALIGLGLMLFGTAGILVTIVNWIGEAFK